MSLSNKIMFDISSRVSGMVLKNSSGAMVPYVSKTSISTTNNLELQHPSMPKKPLGTYFRFLGEIRPIVTKQNPGVKITELSKIMAQKYKELPVARKEVTMTFSHMYRRFFFLHISIHWLSHTFDSRVCYRTKLSQSKTKKHENGLALFFYLLILCICCCCLTLEYFIVS